MNDKEIVVAITDWAVKARYEQTPEGVRPEDVASRQATAAEVLWILRNRGVDYREAQAAEANKIIPAPGRPVTPCFEEPNVGFICSHHQGRRGGAIGCWNLRNPHGEYVKP